MLHVQEGVAHVASKADLLGMVILVDSVAARVAMGLLARRSGILSLIH